MKEKGGGRGRRERGTTKMKGKEKKEEVLHGKGLVVGWLQGWPL